MAIEIPSASNTVGTLASLVAGVAASLLAKAGYLATAATFLGLPEAQLSMAVITLVTAGVNYGVTHFAEVKNLNDMVAAWWPQAIGSYPGDTTEKPVAQGQPNSNINKV